VAPWTLASACRVAVVRQAAAGSAPGVARAGDQEVAAVSMQTKRLAGGTQWQPAWWELVSPAAWTSMPVG
jgi:hypothetical protein